eukprot:COSAG02_NODE_1958_length_10261_cov_16.118973_1_plen_140_part_00
MCVSFRCHSSVTQAHCGSRMTIASRMFATEVVTRGELRSGKSHGYRGSVLNFAQYNGVENAIFASGPGAGTDGPIFCCELQTPVGNLSTDAVIRAQFAGIPKQAAQQEFVVMAVTDALFQMGWSEGSSTATMVETVPIV